MAKKSPAVDRSPFASYIYARRRELDITQEELCEAMDGKICRATLSRWENGQVSSRINDDQFLALAEALQVDLQELKSLYAKGYMPAADENSVTAPAQEPSQITITIPGNLVPRTSLQFQMLEAIWSMVGAYQETFVEQSQPGKPPRIGPHMEP